MIEAARLASCAANRQRLRYIAVVSPEKVAAILPHTFYAALVKPHRTPVPGETMRPRGDSAAGTNVDPGTSASPSPDSEMQRDR